MMENFNVRELSLAYDADFEGERLRLTTILDPTSMNEVMDRFHLIGDMSMVSSMSFNAYYDPEKDRIQDTRLTIHFNNTMSAPEDVKLTEKELLEVRELMTDCIRTHELKYVDHSDLKEMCDSLRQEALENVYDEPDEEEEYDR